MKIFPKLLLSFLIMSLIPLCSITYLVYSHFKKIEIKDSLRDLSEIAKARMVQVENYFEILENNTALIGRTSDVGDALKKLTAYSHEKISSTPAEITQVKELFALMTELSRVNDVFLINLEGEIVYSYKGGEEVGMSVQNEKLKATELAKVYSIVETTFKSYLSDFKIYPVTGKPVIFVGAPVIEQDTLLGVLIFQIPAAEIYNFFDDYTHLGETGEVLMGARKGDGLVFVNPIRYTPDAAFNLEIEFGSDLSLPMQEAVREISGKGITTDYRNHEILAVWRYFDTLNLGIVVKMDLDEVLFEVNQVGNLLILVGAITALVVTLIAIVLAEAISRPIVYLQKAAREIGNGHLDVPIKIKARDELGDLAREIKKMADKLNSSTTSIVELNEEIKKSKELVRSKEELISRVSHELRTPLIPILTGLQFALKESTEGESREKRELLEIAHRNGMRLSELVDNILQYQNAQSNAESDLNRVEVDIHELINEALLLFQDAFANKGIAIEKKLQAESSIVYCEKSQILTVIKSLLDNALKFTDKGAVMVSTAQVDGDFMVRVEDTGIGIKNEDSLKLFQSFRELEMESLDKKQGTGLSLATCKEIITNHKGQIWVEEKEGAGAVFVFSLPQNKLLKST